MTTTKCEVFMSEESFTKKLQINPCICFWITKTSMSNTKWILMTVGMFKILHEPLIKRYNIFIFKLMLIFCLSRNVLSLNSIWSCAILFEKWLFYAMFIVAILNDFSTSFTISIYWKGLVRKKIHYYDYNC